jgi:signal transduction histidine kinase/ligand-binding sensor domain-containing protein
MQVGIALEPYDAAAERRRRSICGRDKGPETGDELVYIPHMGKSQTRASIWLSILLAYGACAFALDPSLDVSQYAHTAWKIREGFTKGTIFSLAQTPDGYLWLGTEFGLVRFDGVQAIPWQAPSGDPLPSDWIDSLIVAHDGTLWIGTEKGLASWKDGKLRKYEEVAGQVITSLLQDPEGTIWFGLREPGRVCAVRGTTTQCYGAGSFGWSVPELYEDHKGNLWVSAQTGVWRWAPEPPEQYRLSGPVEAKAFIEGDNGALLMATGRSGPLAGPVTGSIEGLKQLVDGKIGSYALPGIAGQFNPTRLFRSRDGSLWIGTVQGLLHFHQGRIDAFSVTDGLSGNAIRNIFEDREGNVWVCTENGLDRFREFTVSTVSVNQGLSTSAAYLLEATPDGSIWTITADGLNHWQSGHMTIYGTRTVPGQNSRTDAGQQIINPRVTEVANSGLRGTVSSLGQDDQGRVWAGSSEGVFYFSRTRFVPVPDIPGGTILAIAGDEHGKVWISNNDEGLFYSTPEGAAQPIPWARFGHKYGAAALLPDLVQGGLWLGFFDGGIAYLKDGQVRASYNAAVGLGNGPVNDLQVDAEGAVWAATEGGLSRVKGGRISTLISSNGLPCDAVNSVIEDNDHSFWLYMPCGLVRITRSELDAWVSDSKRRVKTTVFDSSDGVRVRALAGGHSRLMGKSPDGRIWFSPPDGVSVIDPRHLAFNKLPPPVHIRQVTADGKQYAASEGLRLPAKVQDLSIDYTALSLVAPETIHFRFKLEGQDRDWREVVNNREVQYSNLAPGSHRFRLTASNNSGVWNQEGAFLDFTVPPAYYQTNWFRALCAITLLAMVWTAYRLRVGAFARRQAEIRALNEQLIQAQEAERMRISGELHDGVLQQITSLTLRLGKVRRQVPPDSEAKATVSGLQQDLIKIGADIRHLSHELHPALLQDSGLPIALSSYCEEFSKVRGLTVSCETDESVQKLSPGAALCLYRITQEALGNAAKHSKAKNVEVRLAQSDGRVYLTVSDDGVGSTPDQVGKSGGLGLINMRERVLQLDGTFVFDSEPGHGTTVRVTVPFRASS